MQKHYKSLIKKHMLSLALGFHPDLDPLCYAVVVLLGYPPSMVAEITGRSERCVRRWTSGERKMPPDVRNALQRIVRRSAMALRKASHPGKIRMTKSKRQLQKTIVDLAVYLELLCVLPDEQERRDVAREYYREKIRRTGREPRTDPRLSSGRKKRSPYVE